MDDTPNTPPVGGERVPVDIADEMRGSYLAYAMSVIVGRALPDVRDGLKPVHRRVLYAMHEQRNVWNAAYKKSARIVGDVIGKYHPHGDSAVYDTIVRMAQDFSLRYLLVDGQGNFGSVDGDPAAAMRYTEVRMTRLAGEMLADIEKETVNWQDNYDGSEQEPTVLPAAYPNLLVNGSGGIAVGMATNMPPHNLAETIDATVALIEDPEISTRELTRLMPGPDFPTGGVIHGRAGIHSAYETGRGKVQIRAVADIELDEKGDERAIVVTELPYQVNKAQLLIAIADLVRDKKIEGIRDLRDESDRDGMRMVIELKRGAVGQIVLNQLYKMTALQQTFGIINLAIVRGQPKILTLKQLLTEFIHHRRDVVTRRSRHDLAKAKDREHILSGYLRAIDLIDAIVQLIKASAGPNEAREGLVVQFGFSEVQAQAILDLRLQRLTGLERDKIEAERTELLARIAELTEILASTTRLMAVIVAELRAIQAQFGDARRTRIIDATGDIGLEDLIAEEAMVVTLTTTGYIKRTPLSEYRTQKRGGRGRSGMNTKDEDNVANLFVASTHALLLVFTDQGQVYSLKVWEVPASGIAGGGKAIVNLIPLAEGEKVRSVLAVESLEDANRFLVFATRNGVVKRTALDQFKNLRAAGLRAINLGDDDDLVQVKVARPHEAVLLVTARGQAIIFPLDDLRPLGRATQGVRGIKLRQGDTLVALEMVDARELVADEAGAEGGEDAEAADATEIEAPEPEAEGTEAGPVEATGETLVFVTEKGYGKRTPLRQFRVQGRGGLGLRALPYAERNGALVSAVLGRTEDDLMVVTAGGTIIRLSLAEVQVYSRNAKGVRIIKAVDEAVVASYPVPAAEPEASEDVEAALAARRAEAATGGDGDDILDALVRAGEADEATPGDASEGDDADS
jgi:DNA gyrase subunit A